MAVRGACHCGAIAFEVDGEPEGLESCTCSICRRTGFVHWYVEPGRFRLLGSDETLATYRFGTRTALNHFCRVCGVAPFRRPRSDPDKIAVNVRCLEGVDLADLPVTEFDGRNWEEAYARLR
ncbi:MAG: GFA family protein [Myxococcota bacterium]